MNSLRLASLLLLVAPLACEGSTSTTTEESSSSSSGTTSGPSGTTETTGTTGPGVVTTTTPTSEGSESTDGDTGTGTSTTGDTTTGLGPCDGDAPRVVLSTSLGDMTVQLDAVNAPNTVSNFLEYVEAGFYDGTIFHRVELGFVIQGGGFTADLMEKSTNPPIKLEISPELLHVDGAISMARTDDLDSATSQFFICDGEQPQLDGDYAVFGVVVEGLEVRTAISQVPVQEESGFANVPVEDVIIEMAYCVPQGR